MSFFVICRNNDANALCRFRKHGGNFIQCIWIREVEGAENSAERFAAAFEGVPADRVRVFTDAEIGALAQRDVVNGQC